MLELPSEPYSDVCVDSSGKEHMDEHEAYSQMTNAITAIKEHPVTALAVDWSALLCAGGADAELC